MMYGHSLKIELQNLIDRYCRMKVSETHIDKKDDLETIIYNLEECEDIITDLIEDEKYL